MDKPKGPVKSSFDQNDPMEAIYALNIGDFLAEDFISDDLLDKISDSLATDPEKLRMQLDEMIQIYSIDKTLGILGFSSDDGFIIYDSIASTLAEMFQVDACHLFQVAHRDTDKDYLSLTGTSKDLTTGSRWKIGIPLTGNDALSKVYNDNETLTVSSTQGINNWPTISQLSQENVQAFLAVPLVEGKKNLGMITFESYKEHEFSNELIALAQATAQVFVTSIRLQQLVAQAQLEVNKDVANVSELRNLRAQVTESIADLGTHQQTFVECLGEAVDARQDFTKGHSKKVAQIAKAIAEAMTLNEKTIDLVYCAGLLGTIGKMNVPEQVLAKKEKLTTVEWDELRNHPNVGVSLLAQINFLSEVVPYVHYQNERWDGSGQPEGRRAQSIPLGSRILAVADAYQAMTTKRPYRESPMTHDEALKVIQQETEVKWDPQVVSNLVNIPADSLS